MGIIFHSNDVHSIADEDRLRPRVLPKAGYFAGDQPTFAVLQDLQF